MMDLCCDGHDEVCFNGLSCPVCDIIKAAAEDLNAMMAERDEALKAEEEAVRALEEEGR
jgi:hypothetical protein